MPQQLLVGYVSMPAAERVAYYSGLVRSRLIWLGVGVIICLLILVWQWSSMTTGYRIALFIAGLGYSLIWLVIALVGWSSAKAHLRNIGQGIALTVGQRGVWINQKTIPWDEIAAISIRRARAAAGPVLVVATTAGEKESMPFLYLDVVPATIDSAIRAYSHNTRSLDLSKIGN
ncbi:MAG: hypothetical protein LBM23_05260 [Propionibacteriaceae bacterium]|jgi:hypothetical protein|nr:hypothetical protein [Propionibacteriaceae bacterium]